MVGRIMIRHCVNALTQFHYMMIDDNGDHDNNNDNDYDDNGDDYDFCHGDENHKKKKRI